MMWSSAESTDDTLTVTVNSVVDSDSLTLAADAAVASFTLC